MEKSDNTGVISDGTPSAREWVRQLAKYRDPDHLRSAFEIFVTAVPFIAIWSVAWWALSISYWLAFGLAVANGFFVVRLFAIQHDCGHSAFFRNRHIGDWVGRVLGVLTLTPYDVWRRSHSIHHSSSGNLEKRGMGDVHTMTVHEYRALSRSGRLMYQLYRHPLVLFGLGPVFIFFLCNRVPFGLMRNEWRYWTSAMGTNLSIAVALGVIVFFGGWMPLLLVFLPTSIAGATLGVWLFYVQHQFEQTQWDQNENWDLHDAALHGSSHYVLPGVLQWMTANIGIHHVHHLYSRIPFYRLTEVLRDFPQLASAQRLTVRESLGCVWLQLWDERERKLLTYAQARDAYGPIAGPGR
ncbi:MAG: fatty acid desaturase [Paracoccaceae bacterium]